VELHGKQPLHLPEAKTGVATGCDHRQKTLRHTGAGSFAFVPLHAGDNFLQSAICCTATCSVTCRQAKEKKILPVEKKVVLLHPISEETRGVLAQ
jgi:hypothetical protein